MLNLISFATVLAFGTVSTLAASSICANGSTVGTYASPTLPKLLDLEKRNSFVKRQGTKLTLAGEPFRMVGTNIYWLGLDENVIPDPSYPSKGRVVEALGDVSAMQGTVVRGHTLGVSFGNPLSVLPAKDTYNQAAYESIDWAIFVARVFGLKLLIPLVDNYNWYHGGKYQFIGWAGIPFSGTGSSITPPDVGAYFYNTTSIVNDFKSYITHHLNHVNQYTGLAYKNDPTILGWESGNELSAVLFGDGPAPPAWTAEIGTLIKSLAPNQMFMDGSYGIFPETFVNKQVDIFSDHFYPANITKLQTGASLVKGTNRVYWAGEFDWVGKSGGDPVPAFLSAIEAIPGIGDAFWSLFAHDDNCCQYVEHNDGFAFYYPGRANQDATKAPLLAKHAAKMNPGAANPEILPALACQQYGSKTKLSFPESLLEGIAEEFLEDILKGKL